MTLSSARLHLYYSLVERVSAWTRRRRMQQMTRRMQLGPGMKVLDLGGLPGTWRGAPGPLQITVLNMPGTEMTPEPGGHRFSYVECDACHVEGLRDGSFDMVFSNSVIEHVGGEEQQRAFAQEVRRLGDSYWVQTPAIWFPIEAHTGLPFWWFYPRSLRQRFLRRWHQTLPEWADSIGDTRVLSRDRIAELFPEARIYVETVLGIPKSYTAWYRGQHAAPAHSSQRIGST